MCTAISFKNKNHYFGRNLDLGCSLNEQITITPRNYLFQFRKGAALPTHYAMIGIAYVPDDYPLYYDATNEMGLSMAGLNFPGEADYKSFHPDKNNVSPFEFIPWILGQCSSVKDAQLALNLINLFKSDYSDTIQLSPLHWIIADEYSSIVVESVKEGLKIYPNPVGILTNVPPFDKQILNLVDESSDLPGDWASQSRFARAAYVKKHTPYSDSELESVSHFFHILDSVAQPKGCTKMPTQYSCCCNTKQGIYYYKTYDNSRISAVNMYHKNLDGQNLITYPLLKSQQIYWQN